MAASFDPRRNSINALRLGLASLVVVSHAWPLTGRGADPSFGGQSLGTWAVAGFFVLSGFLITRSRLRSTAARFYRDRFLRIYPAYSGALLVIAFIAAPLSVLLRTGSSYDGGEVFSYLLRAALLSPPRVAQPGIGTTLAGLPYPDVWDGPMWTLFYEAACYVAIGVVVTLLPRRLLGLAALTSAVGLSVAVLAWQDQSGVPFEALWLARFGVCFSVGSCLYLFRYRVPVGPVPVTVAATALGGVVLVGQAPALAAAPLGLLLLMASARLPLSWVGRRHDLSYGVYLYAWPVQMFVVLAGVSWGWRPGLTADIVLVLAVSAVLALASAVLVEEPALRLKQRARTPSRVGPASRPGASARATSPREPAAAPRR